MKPGSFSELKSIYFRVPCLHRGAIVILINVTSKIRRSKFRTGVSASIIILIAWFVERLKLTQAYIPATTGIDHHLQNNHIFTLYRFVHAGLYVQLSFAQYSVQLFKSLSNNRIQCRHLPLYTHGYRTCSNKKLLI
ncbi:hypothetical protein O6H91_03G092000 [Diphasiastrum complanatum]|uniref:Uncharacterized protein n=1 Tax=Diphasiastrum complanatum TaxID=34168 RepID=A0ACC2E8P1_DIPCM|nr:hypothetical protein O6H91_03G092000 [Diphasiastrum complanatum]